MTGPGDPAAGPPAPGGGAPPPDPAPPGAPPVGGTAPGPRPTTSALSVAEAAAVRRLGLVPNGFVLGTAVVQVVSTGGYGGAGFGPVVGPTGVTRMSGATSYPCAHMMGFAGDHWGFVAEDGGYAASVALGYDLATDRLRAEARQLGAHGVVGVELVVGDLVGGVSTWTFRATGTAVSLPGAPPVDPFVTNAPGQQVERLVALGLAPVALVTGVGACYVQPNCRTRGDLTVPGPVDQLPHALSIAQHRARQRLHQAATQHGGDGVVHTWWVDRRVPAWGEGWIQTTVATGTVVRRVGDHRVPAAPRPVVPLRP